MYQGKNHFMAVSFHALGLWCSYTQINYNSLQQACHCSWCPRVGDTVLLPELGSFALGLDLRSRWWNRTTPFPKNWGLAEAEEGWILPKQRRKERRERAHLRDEVYLQRASREAMGKLSDLDYRTLHHFTERNKQTSLLGKEKQPWLKQTVRVGEQLGNRWYMT